MRTFSLNSDILVDWIIKHRRGKAFLNYPKEKIKSEIERAYSLNCLEVLKDAEGNITGVMVGEPKLYVKHILTIKPNVLLKIIKIMKVKFGNFSWMAFRKGRFVEYEKVERGIRFLGRKEAV